MVNTEMNGPSQLARRSSRRAAREAKIISKVSKAERMLDRSGIRPILKIEERVESERRAFEKAYSIVSLFEESLPSTLNFALGWQQEEMISDLERSLEAFRRYLLSIPSPNPLTPLELQAREAWQRYDEGDPEPLDTFTKRRLGIMPNHDGPLPDDLRERVFQFLDCCFAPSPLYPPGTWFLLGRAESIQLPALLQGHIKRFPELEAALSDKEDKTYSERLAEELPAVVRVAWDDIQLVSSATLLNETTNAIRRMRPRGNPLPDEITDQSLAQFEALELVRQELDTLELEAGFSSQQASVWRLLREGMGIAEIADTLGTTPNQVSVQKYNAIEKARRVASR
jgi:DNA-binding CsgD family transcriptional regulator